jgi:hypothetical protein
MFPYDEALLAAVHAAPRTIDDVVATLAAIEAVLPETDGLLWFNRLYRQVTEAVRERVASPAGFTNPPWIALLDVEFAKLYLQAVECQLGGQPVPGCWRAVLERRGNPAIARIQFALAGMNAHINHDLPVALIETFRLSGATPQSAGIQYDDYSALNTTLESLIDTAKAELHVRLPGDALPPVSHLQESLAAWSVVAAREAAWTNSELLWDVRDIPLLSGRYLDVIDGLATVAGKALLVPVPMA